MNSSGDEQEVRPLSRREQVNIARDMAAFVTARWAGDVDRSAGILGALEGRELPIAFGALASIVRVALECDPGTPPAVFLAVVQDRLDDGADR